MNNGEGTRENASEVASPDVSDSFPPKLDGGDVPPASLSQCSSFGEFEFEQYRSANSVTGTSSMRSLYVTSLNDCLDSEFGSLKSLGFREDVNFENFSLGGIRKVSTLGDHKIEFCKQRNDDEDVKLGSGFSALPLCDDSYEGRIVNEDMTLNSFGMVSGDHFELEGPVDNLLIGGSCSDVGSGERSVNGVRDAVDIEEAPSLCVDNKDKGSCQDGLHLQFGSEFDGREIELEQDETSSKHSEGEDSIYDYSTDEEHNNKSYYPRNVEYVQEAKYEKENPLLINSHVAFGLEDWDDFEQEVGGGTMSSLMLDKFQKKRDVNVESDRNVLDSVSPTAIPTDRQKEQNNDVKDLPGVSRKVQDANDSEENINITVENPAWSRCHVNQEPLEEEKDISATSYQVHGADVLAENSKSSFSDPINLPRFSGLDEGVSSVVRNQVQRTENTESSSPMSICLPRFSGLDEDEGDISIATNEVQDADDVTMCHNYGSDEGHKNKSYYPRNIEYVQEAKYEKENPLLINSHVAFGLEDWDDFEQEMGTSTISSLMLDKFQEKREANVESDRNALDSVSPIVIPSDCRKEQNNDVKDLPGVSRKVQDANDSEENINITVENPAWSPCHVNQEPLEEEKDIPADNYQVQGADVLAENSKSSFSAPINLPRFAGLDEGVSSFVRNQVQGTENTESSSHMPICLLRFSGPNEDEGDISIANSEVQDADDVTKYHNFGSVSNAFVWEQEPLVEAAPLKMGLDIIDSRLEIIDQYLSNKEPSTNDSGILEKEEFGYFKAQLAPLADIPIDQPCVHSIGSANMSNSEIFEDCEPKLSPPTFVDILSPSKNAPASADLSDNHLALTKKENLELHDFYDEVVHEMEEILLDYNESPGAMFSPGNQIFKSQVSLPLRDGGSTASTSGTDDVYPPTVLPLKIDGVEVVGAKQKKGDVSLSERLVGVKEYTVYKIRVWSRKDQWEVERRYRDFFTLYRRLKSFYADQGLILPSPWSSVEKESRKIFGNASPDVVAERSVLIQECLQAVICSSSFSSLPGALIWFLSPQESLPSSPVSNIPVSQSTSFTGGADAQNISPLGKTISLIVAIQPQKSMKQMIEVQHYTCAGCRKHFDDGMTLIQDFVQTFGWGKPRLCEYTGQLFCSSCHTSDTAVLPARVLHHWDFTQYPVSQLAKSYLDSVHDQPMLCVSAVNPFLYSKVPALQHALDVRKKIGAMLSLVHCPFRRSIDKGLGSRRYLLENNDFFALRDLIDLSKGPFAALPVMVENVSRKILEHITEQCLICCDAGVPCSAQQACNDPSSLIFTFQEGDTEKCKACEAVFHKPCFRKLAQCPCGASLGMDEAANSAKRVSHNDSGETNGALITLEKRTGFGLSAGLLSGLFSRAKLEKSDNVILMGSLPSTTL
ncbi:uncharacterized protein LOC123210085 [Mangifera indica]|uniref:uncharacterized protein LOC123210085 n=1 Tax=Mangifera indica TaxID=29780 RepID=UPI001CFA9950|nr:uncharacterized protein LOC123210085 [Mangifera indica]